MMNREKCKELLDNGLFEAFASGKTIQVKSFGDENNDWIDIKNPNFDGDQYRVKPETKYTQFTADTASSAGLYKRKVSFNNQGIYNVFIGENSAIICSCHYSFKEVLDHCKFLDTGEVCGTLVEEPE